MHHFHALWDPRTSVYLAAAINKANSTLTSFCGAAGQLWNLIQTFSRLFLKIPSGRITVQVHYINLQHLNHLAATIFFLIFGKFGAARHAPPN